MLDWLIVLFGLFMDASTTGACKDMVVYELCVTGGNPVPEELREDYWPVKGPDVAIEVRTTF